MSHIVEIKTEVRDPAAMELACQRLGLENPQQGTATLFTQQVSGWIVQLPQWRFPVVVDAGSGQVQYDNYEGRWGEIDQLHRFLQTYAVEKAKLEARKQGHSITEQSLADGSIKLAIQIGGAA
jgi:hypothetical protein